MARIDTEWLDRMYNNRARVPEHVQHLAAWASLSEAARASHPCVLDLAYGDGPKETLDIFTPAGAAPTGAKGGKGAPVLVFIHGGWWRSLDKSDHSFIAPAYTQDGACVVMPNYALCPAVTIPQIVMQTVKALAWTWRNIAAHGGDPKRITVVGHSAGGHLAAMMLACVWKAYAADLPARLVKNAMSISGLHELESIRHTPFLQEALRLTPAQAKKASPAWLPAPSVAGGRGLLYSVAGGDESEEFLRQNALIQTAWGKRVVPVCEALPGLNHFSILSALATPGEALHGRVSELLAA